MSPKELDHYISRFILTRNERRYDIERAPFKIGQHVLILDNPNNDETFDNEYIGSHGKIVFFEYDCGCGQSYPSDPMMGVVFDDDSIAEFWKEELELVS